MQEGRLPWNTYKRCIEKNLKTRRKEVLFSGSPGKEGTVIQLSYDRAFAAFSGTALSCGEEGLRVAFARVQNGLAAFHAVPVSTAAQIALPPDTPEPVLRQILTCLDGLCQQAGIQCVSGPVFSTRSVTEPLVSLTACGNLEREKSALTPVFSAPEAQAGDALLMAGYAGLSGTALLSVWMQEELQKRFQGELLERSRRLLDYISTVPEAAVAGKHGAGAMHAAAEGGILAALWDFSSTQRLGLTVDLKAIPIRQETVEICEYLGVNPYQLAADGALLMAVPEPQALLTALRDQGIPAVVIGRLTDSNDRILCKGEDTGFLERPKADEIFRYLPYGSRNISKSEWKEGNES